MADAVLFDKDVIARKPHQCAHCRAEIAIGARHRSTVQIYDGRFNADRTHHECEAAFKDLNYRLRDAHWSDELHFLADDDIEDGEREWLRETHPVVAERLWPSAAPASPWRRQMIDELIERVEKGEGADRELDCLLVAVLDGRTIRQDGSMILARNSRPPHDEYIVGWIDPGETRRNFSEGHSVPPVRRYTTSLDAILALFEEKLSAITDNSPADFLAACIEEMMARGFRPHEPNGPQICRAALAAFLRAHKEQHDGR